MTDHSMKLTTIVALTLLICYTNAVPSINCKTNSNVLTVKKNRKISTDTSTAQTSEDCKDKIVIAYHCGNCFRRNFDFTNRVNNNPDDKLLYELSCTNTIGTR
jgi:hypothetical protein